MWKAENSFSTIICIGEVNKMTMETLRKYQLKYYDSYGDLVAIRLHAKDKQHCIRIFRTMYGEYDIESIKEYK